MSPAEQAAWPEQLFSRWHSGIPLCKRCCISCLRGWGGKEESKPCTQGGFVPGLPQGRTQQEVDILEEEKVKSQAGSGESQEAVGFLPDTVEVTASTGIPLPAHLFLQLIHGGAVVGNTEWSNARACTESLGSILGKRRRTTEGCMEGCSSSICTLQRTHIHARTTLIPSKFCQTCSQGWLAASTHKKAVSQLMCTGKEMWRAGEARDTSD